MKRLLVAILLAAFGWAAYWSVSAWQVNRQVDAWFAARQAEGWTASYDSRSLSGFPNRLDLSFEGLSLSDPQSGASYRANRLDILRLVYDPAHLILAFGSDQELTTPQGGTWIDSTGLRASLRQTDGALTRLNLEAESLSLSGAAGTLALAEPRAALAATPEAPATYQLGLTAEAAAGRSANSADGVKLRGTVALTAPLPVVLTSAPRPQPRALEIDLAEFRQADLLLQLAGDLAIDPAGRPTGDLTLRAENWQGLLAEAQRSGQLPAAVADGITQAIGLIAGLSGRRDQIDLPLRLSGDRVWLGPLPIGPAPRLVLP